MTTTSRAERLVHLFARGRALQFENTSVLFARVRRRHPGARPNALVELVYTAVLVLFAFLFLEARGYLDDARYDAFTDDVFARATGARAARVKSLIDTYASALPDLERMSSLVAHDLAAALSGESDPEVARALMGTTRSLKKLAELYVAVAFDDAEMVKKLS